MSAPSEVRLSTRLQRKDASLPVFVVIPNRHIRLWHLAGTTVVEGSANGHSFGRRTIKAWGKGSDNWFLEFTAPFCKTASLKVGERVVLDLRLADMSTPKELEVFLSKDRKLMVAWSALSDRQRRDAAEHIRAAKSEVTRQGRAAVIVDKLRAAN